jgi:methylisocitrate lyase
MAARTVEQYIRAGVAGAHLEDQVLTKRCGHLSGKKVVSREEYISRIRAAHAARVRMRSEFVLIARTDALQQHGYDECIARLRLARDEGADVGLLEGFTSKAQAAQAVRDLAPWPLLLNSVENGKSPTITVDEARAMGFRIIIFSFATLAPAYTAIRDTLLRLKTQGVVGTAEAITPVKLFEVCGLKHSSKFSPAFVFGIPGRPLTYWFISGR